jgi:hypothetical protein
MKAKTTIHRLHRHRTDEPVPHELGCHLFALIKRNLLARRAPRPARPAASQLTFAF